MFSVIFEVHPKEGKKDEYLGLAKHLKPLLEAINGFIDNERFESKLRPGWMLSHSTWRDEKSVVRWRTDAEHHAVQEKGRYEIFEDYRLRVGEVISDTDPPPEAPIREQRLDETEVGHAKFVTFTEITPEENTIFATQADLLPSHLGLDRHSGAIVEHDVLAKKAKAHVIVAKLDRLSRDVHYISGLMKHRVPFIVAELGADTDPFMLHIYAALAEKERLMISQRTKAAMKAAKARGVTLGGLRDKGEELYRGKQKNAPKDSVACLKSFPGCLLGRPLKN